MKHFPIFLDLSDQLIVVSGAGEVAVAKLRLLLKTPSRIRVFGEAPDALVLRWASEGLLRHEPRELVETDTVGARLLYAANGDAVMDHRAAMLGRQAGALVNIVDSLDGSDFLTPAIVDRDPVTVAIGTEGSAPVLARRIKAGIEETLPPTTGAMARFAQSYRAAASDLPQGRSRRRFWTRFFSAGHRELQARGEDGARGAIDALLAIEMESEAGPGRVSIVGAGPGDPELLTLRARNVLHDADVVIHDRLVPAQVLELARREAEIVEVGKIPGGASWAQDDINALLVRHAAAGAHVVRLKSGDPAVYGRLDEEMDALDKADIAFDVVPGITTAIAAAAALKVSLTQRGRNSSFRLLTGHDVDGFAEQDWRNLSRAGAVAAIYMGLRAARFLQGRLMIHGASAETPVTAVENVSRCDQRIVQATLGDLPDALERSGISGPVVIFLGLAPRYAAEALSKLPKFEEAL